MFPPSPLDSPSHLLSILTPLGYYRGLLTQTQSPHLSSLSHTANSQWLAVYICLCICIHAALRVLPDPAKSSSISQERRPALGKTPRPSYYLGAQARQRAAWPQCMYVCVSVRVSGAQSCPTLCNSMEWSPPGSSVQEILQARILERPAIPFSRGSSWPKGRTQVSCIAGRFFTIWATREDPGHSGASPGGWVEPKGDVTEGSPLPARPEAEGQVPLAGQSQLYNPTAATSVYTLRLSRILSD